MIEFDEYKILGEPNKKEKSEIWETAIGLQQVDGLKPSSYLIETAKSHINGDITFENVKNQISNYYKENPAKTETQKQEQEADLVSARIAEILSEKGFSLGYVEFKEIHRRLFEGIYEFAGKIRTYNIEKAEWVLNGKSVTCGNYTNIKEYIEYYLREEKNFNFKNIEDKELLRHIAEFTSRLWQIHAFGEGNTRTVAVFVIKYLNTLGFNVDYTLFSKNSWYFRNSLVRANYVDYKNNIYTNFSYLINFFENLLFNGKNTLKNRYLKISFDTVNDTVKSLESKIISLIKDNNRITTKEISEKTEKSIATIKRKIKILKDNGLLERVGADKHGCWKIIQNN